MCVERQPLLEADGLARAGGVDAVLGPVRAARRPTTRTRCSPRRADARGRGGVAASAGTAAPTTSSASTASARRRPGAVVLEKLGFTAEQRRPSEPRALIDAMAMRRRPRRRGAETGWARLQRAVRRAGPEPVARQPQAGLDHLRRAAAVGRPRRARHHVEPDDLPEGHRRSADYDEQFGDARAAAARPSRTATGTLVTDRHRGRPRASCARSTTRATASTASCRVEVAPGLARDTEGTIAAATSSDDADRRAQPLREDPRHRRGPRRHPPLDRRGPLASTSRCCSG